MTHRRALLAAFCSALLLGLAWGCSAADTGANGFPGTGGGNGVGEGGNDEQTLSPDGATTDPDGGIVLNPLCGKAPSCVPDAPHDSDSNVTNSCASYVPPAVPMDDGSAGTQAIEAGASGEGGASGSSATSSGGNGAEPGTAGEGGASFGGEGGASEGGEGGAAGATGTRPAKFGCQVHRIASAPKTVTSECAVVGLGGVNAPCLTSSDCKAGYGCVGDQNAGLCQSYCCQSGDNCDAGKYCAERPLRDAVTNALAKDSTDTSSTLMIPVCVPAENCDLSAPYPCTDGTQCACKTGTACLVVRSDGTTTCAVPGNGKVGEACPCAWGHVCSAATNQCLQLCYTRGTPSCGTGKCQSASELPEGWGVCVGATPSAG